MTLVYTILIPLIAGVLCLLIPKKAKGVSAVIALLGCLATFGLTIQLFLQRPLSWSLGQGWSLAQGTLLRIDNLSGFILMAIGLFGVLIALYSIGFMAGKPRLNEYYAYLLWTIATSCGAVLANNLVLFLVFWGFGALTLYLLIGIGGPDAAYAAKKTFVIVGGSDAIMILGVAAMWFLTHSYQMDKITIPITGGLSALAFLCLLAAAIAKAGAMPLHTWIPDSSEVAPVPIMAFLPASLDKLLGIYLLARCVLHLFVIIPNSAVSVLLMIIGGVTVVAAVMMALIQHNLKRLLSYHAVSQVGYMVLGIGTGIPIGIAGGLFHMLNHAIYKCCLFLTGASVEHRAKTTELDQLGGLAKFMPLTFISCLIASLSISGIPPFNGFVSKWMVYQGTIQLFSSDGGPRFTVFLCLVAAMFGSALTLASFMKVLHATFLGEQSPAIGSRIKEVGFGMWFPMVVLAGLCVLFGVFAFAIPLKYFINPAVGAEVVYTGFWRPSLATGLIFIGILVGFIIYWMGTLKNVRADTAYVGGEVIPSEARVTGIDFYRTVRELGVFKGIYNLAEKKVFDIYDQGTKLTLFLARRLQNAHSGILPTYLVWCLIGMLVIFYILFKNV